MQIKFEADILMAAHQTLDRISSGKDMPVVVRKGLSMADCGFVLIGTAEVTAKLYSRDKLVQSQIDSLNQQLQSERAESQRRQNAILDKISKLQALEFTPA